MDNIETPDDEDFSDFEDVEIDAGEIDESMHTEKRGILDKLMNTNPATPLEQMEDPWNPKEGGTTRILRGVQKIGDIEGLPAIADILIGTLEELYLRAPWKQAELSENSEPENPHAGGGSAEAQLSRE